MITVPFVLGTSQFPAGPIVDTGFVVLLSAAICNFWLSTNNLCINHDRCKIQKLLRIKLFFYPCQELHLLAPHDRFEVGSACHPSNYLLCDNTTQIYLFGDLIGANLRKSIDHLSDGLVKGHSTYVFLELTRSTPSSSTSFQKETEDDIHVYMI